MTRQKPAQPADMHPAFDVPAALDTRTLSERGSWLDLRHPDGAPVLNGRGAPVRLLLAGPDSNTFRAAVRALARARGEATIAEIDLEAAFLADITLGWEGVEAGAAPVPFTRDDARRFYGLFPRFAEQADEHAGKRERFSLGVPTN